MCRFSSTLAVQPPVREEGDGGLGHALTGWQQSDLLRLASALHPRMSSTLLLGMEKGHRYGGMNECYGVVAALVAVQAGFGLLHEAQFPSYLFRTWLVLARFRRRNGASPTYSGWAIRRVDFCLSRGGFTKVSDRNGKVPRRQGGVERPRHAAPESRPFFASI